MNDLAQQAIGALVAVRGQLSAALRARQSLALAVAGFAAAALAVVAGGRIGTTKSVIPLTRWFGLMSANGTATGDYWPGALMLVGIVALVLLWLMAIRANCYGLLGERDVWALAGAWALPFIAGPPLLSNDVYTYAAQGLMQRDGFSPYTDGPTVLGASRAVAAVDPNWRAVGSPYGTLATTIQHLAVSVSGGSALGAVIVFRALAVVCVVIIGVLAADLAGPRRAQALTLTVANPLVLLQIVSAAHFEGVMCALLLGALVAANQRRWALAIVLAGASGAIKAPALLAVLAVIAVHAAGQPRAAALRTMGRDVVIAAASLGALTLLVPHGFGWIANLETPALGHTPYTPASLIGDVLRPVVLSASYDDLATGGRIAALLAAGCAVIYLIGTAHRRALNRTAGYGLLAIGLLSPVLYPWYLLWGLLCLAPTVRAARADWLVLASGLACVVMPPGLPKTTKQVLTVAAVAIALAVIAPRVLRRYRSTRAQLTAAG